MTHEIDKSGARCDVRLEEGKVLLTVTRDGQLVSQMRLTPGQAESIAMQMLLAATQAVCGSNTI